MAHRAYLGLTAFKSKAWLNYSGTTEDAYLRGLLELASEIADAHCHRRFQPYLATKYFTARDAYGLWVPDLLSINASGLVCDDDDDATYSDTWTTDQYELWSGDKESRDAYPRLRLDVDGRATTTNSFPLTQRGVKITGLWGHGDGETATPWLDSGADVATGGWTAAATSIAVATGHGALLDVGKTYRVDSEDIYVQTRSTDTLTLVVRGVNGTTAATHNAAAALNEYLYPAQVAQAVGIIATKAWRAKDSGYSGVLGNAETGIVRVRTDLVDAAVERVLAPYRLMVVA